MEMIREYINFTFHPRYMLLSLQIGLSFVRAAVAWTILDNPRYSTKLLSFHLNLPLEAINAVCHQLGLLSTDHHLILVQVSSILSTMASSSCSSSSRASMSLANLKFVIFLPPMLTFPSCSSRASVIFHSRKMLKSVGGRSHPCLTSTGVLNHSSVLLFISTALAALS